MRAGMAIAAAALVTAASGAVAQPLGRPDVPVLVGEFKGTLPCPDCAGVETALTLVQKDEGTAEGSYVMIETFTGKSADPVVTEGNWTTLRGSAADPDDTVYELNPDNLGASRDFVKADDLTIRLLGPGQKELATDGSTTLRSAADPYAGMPNPAAINCVRIGGQSVIHEGTTAGEQGVCRLPDGRECEEFAVLRDHRCLDPAKPAPPVRRGPPPGAGGGGSPSPQSQGNMMGY
jgi:putative hemolysin